MTARTAWTAGNGVGLTWTTGVNSSDLASMVNGSSVLSTVADIANGTNLDLFADVSISFAIASSTVAAGANIAFWLYLLNQDGSTYGDNKLPTPGTQVAMTPSVLVGGIINLFAAAAQTTLIGNCSGILLPPGSFRFAVQNNSGFTLTSGTQTFKYRTYNTNLNN